MAPLPVVRYREVMVVFRREDVLAFLSRDWAGSRQRKHEHWTGPGQTPSTRLRAAEALRLHMKIVHPEWPTRRDRAADLRHHVRLSKLLARAARAFPAVARF